MGRRRRAITGSVGEEVLESFTDLKETKMSRVVGVTPCRVEP